MIKKRAQSIVIVLSEKMQMDVTIESSDYDVTGVCDVTLPSSVHECDIADISLADSNDFNLRPYKITYLILIPARPNFYRPPQ